MTANWIRYRHRERPEIEYDVACYPIPGGGPISSEFKGERCFHIRTVRNISFAEEVHQPAYTMMPANKFIDTYEKVREVAA